MVNLVKNIALLPGLAVVKIIRLFVSQPSGRLYIRRPRTSPLAIIVAVIFWGAGLSYGLISYSRGHQSEPAAAPAESEQNPDPTAVLQPLSAAGSNPPAPAQEEPNETPPPETQVWLVILRSVPKKSRSEADQQVINYKKRGLEAQVFDTDALPKLKAGFWAVALGPYENKEAADRVADLARETVPDLMVRRGL